MTEGEIEYTGPLTATHGWHSNEDGDMVFRIEVTAPRGDAPPVFLCEFARQIAEQLCEALGVTADGSKIKLSGELTDMKKGAH